MAAPNILIVGATGKQGGAVIHELSKTISSDSPLKLLALTRNPNSASARRLKESHPDIIELVQGDTTEPEAIFSQWPNKGHISGVFLVTAPGKVSEEEQGIPFIDAAVAHGVKHIVFSSVDRGGEEKSWNNPTDVKHFWEKHNIELHLRDKAAKQAHHPDFTWTIIRPVAFFDNWSSSGGFAGMFTAMWATSLSPEKKLQLVSVRDIGVWASMALSNPGKWAGRAISLAGDELTLDEAKEKWRNVVGEDMPQSWGIAAKGLLWFMGDMGAMFRWFEREGYGADIEELRMEENSLQDMEAWLKHNSGWVHK